MKRRNHVLIVTALIVLLGYFFAPVSTQSAMGILGVVVGSIGITVAALLILVLLVAWVIPRTFARFKRSRGETAAPEAKSQPKEVSKGAQETPREKKGIIPLLLLWVSLVIAVALGNPKVWALWGKDWGYFIATQIVAVALIVFAVKSGWQKYAGAVIALMLALSLLYSPEEPVRRADAKGIGQMRSGEKVETYTVTRDKWTMIRVPDHHYFYFDCAGKVAVDILDNRIPINECDNHRKPITVGNNIQPARHGSSGAFAMKALEDNRVTVTVTTWPM